MLLALFEGLLFDYRQDLFASLEEFFESFKIQSFSKRSFRAEKIELVLGLVRGANDHAIAVEATERSWLKVGKNDHLSFHLLNRDVFLQARCNFS